MESKSLTNELLDLFHASAQTPTASTFIPHRNKIKPKAFESVFKNFSKYLMDLFDKGMLVFAIDGSDIQVPTDSNDTDSYIAGTNGHKGYNLLHINALYDLNKHIYSDVIIQKAKERDEHKAFQELVDYSEITKALVIDDRGYESFNSMAHIQEKGWFFLIRVKDGNNGIKQGLNLPETECFDIDISLNLTIKKINAVKDLFKDKNHYRMVSSTQPFDYLPLKNRKAEPVKFYELNFRIVRFPISEDTYETGVTNLDKGGYSLDGLKKLYASRWGIETSFRDLKYTIGLLNFHSKKVMYILREIYVHMTMYNFAEMLTSHVVIEKKQRKHIYKANFSVAAHICRLFYRGKTTPPDLEAIIAKNLIAIRPDRHRERNVKAKNFQGFDFLGYTFKAIYMKCRDEVMRHNFISSVSKTSAKNFRDKIKALEIHKKTGCKIDIIAEMLNPLIRGWMNHFGKFNPSAMKYTLQCIERRIVKWAMCKYKNFHGHRKRAKEWFSTVRKREPKLFAHLDRMYS